MLALVVWWQVAHLDGHTHLTKGSHASVLDMGPCMPLLLRDSGYHDTAVYDGLGQVCCLGGCTYSDGYSNAAVGGLLAWSHYVVRPLEYSVVLLVPLAFCVDMVGGVHSLSLDHWVVSRLSSLMSRALCTALELGEGDHAGRLSC